MTIVTVLPNAPERFDRREEQNFRDWVRRGFNKSLGKFEIPVFSGMPVISAKGTSSAFHVSSGAAPLYIPMEAIVYDFSDPTLSTSPHTIKAPYDGFAQLSMRLDNVATGSGTATSD